MKPLHQVNISTGKDSLAPPLVTTCPRCDNTGFKDYAGFAMDLCECRMPPCPTKFDFSERCIEYKKARIQQETNA
ncbi:hypothetical protein [Novosphingobium humi]|uniref:hypothetical protein n=1 Tax=Novosphingobium humi TaxID=2282397 RepID=UPI0025AF3865|nr:hypothetical protein [Novosphingobium humi]WJS98234.1 hypothetical protein NYQ05_14035 [Novosphingobium humi]